MRATFSGKEKKVATDDASDEDLWFSYLYVISLAVLAVLCMFLSDVSPTRKLLVFVLSAVGALVFVFHTHAEIRKKEQRIIPGGIIALIIGVALFAMHPMFFFGLFALYPLCFIAFPDRYEGFATAVLGIASEVSIAGWNDWTLGGWAFAAVQAGLGALFAFTMGRWIDRIIHQSRERGTLLEALESTRAELAEVHRAAGVSAERDRMGTEIHDTVAQGFTSLVMLLRGAQASLDTNPDAVRHLLRVAEQTAQENLDEARALVTNSRPVALQDAPIQAALTRLTTRFYEETGVLTTIDVVGVPRNLDPAHDVVLLRAAQEALANIRKHARATTVQINLRFSEDHVDLEVVDNGAGFDVASRSSGYGLSGMKTRVSQVGGSLHVASSLNQGTRVQVTL